MKILIAILLLVSTLAHAQAVTLAWDSVTNYTTGGTITEPVYYKLYRGPITATYAQATNGNVVRISIDTNVVYNWSIAAGTNTQITVTNPAAGFYGYGVTAWAGDTESGFSSNVAQRIGSPSTVKAVRTVP